MKGEPITPRSAFYGSVTFRPIEMTGKAAVGLGKGPGVRLLELKAGLHALQPQGSYWNLSVCFLLCPMRIIIIVLSHRGVLKTKWAENLPCVPGA